MVHEFFAYLKKAQCGTIPRSYGRIKYSNWSLCYQLRNQSLCNTRCVSAVGHGMFWRVADFVNHCDIVNVTKPHNHIHNTPWKDIRKTEIRKKLVLKYTSDGTLGHLLVSYIYI